MLAFSIYFELISLEVEFDPKVLFVNRPDVALSRLEVVEFVLESPAPPADVVAEFDCENADVVNEGTATAAAKTVFIIVTVKIILMLNFVLLLLINYNLV